MGLTALALTKGLEMMAAPLKDVSSIANSLPREEDRYNLLNAVHKIQEETLAPVGHGFKAGGYDDKRRDALAQAVRDRILQQQLKFTPLGFDSFFKEDISTILQTATARQQALTSAIRGGRTAAPASSRSHDRSRSPVRRQPCNISNYSARSFLRTSALSRGRGGGAPEEAEVEPTPRKLLFVTSSHPWKWKRSSGLYYGRQLQKKYGQRIQTRLLKGPTSDSFKRDPQLFTSVLLGTRRSVPCYAKVP